MNMLGVWMWPYSIREKGAEAVMDVCHRAHVTDIFFLAKGLEGTTAFCRPFAPAVCERDLLQELLTAAHARGIRVHAWFTSACDEYYKNKYPESGRCHIWRGKDRELVSLADEGYLKYMEDIVRDVCRCYDIDGLHLDYIRYNHMLYGWDEKDLARYQAAGADVDALKAWMDKAYAGEEKHEEWVLDGYRSGDKDLRAYARVRRQDVKRFATALCRIAKEEKPNITLSAALMPEGAYPDSAYADLHYGQSYEDAAQLYDLMLPMTYAQAYGKDSAWVRDVALWTLARGKDALMGLHAYEDGTGPLLMADEAGLCGSGVSGVCLFREGAFVWAFADGEKVDLVNPLPDAVTKIVVHTDEGDEETDVPIPANGSVSIPCKCKVQSVSAYTEKTEVPAYLVQE